MSCEGPASLKYLCAVAAPKDWWFQKLATGQRRAFWDYHLHRGPIPEGAIGTTTGT